MRAGPPAPAAAQVDATHVPRPRIGLVLSGGGARGLAHVGVLQVLERERIPVDLVVGTSMGAIVGGLYASGLSADDVAREVRQLDWGQVFASRVDRRALSQRRKEQDFEVSPLLEVGVGANGVLAPLGSVSTRGLESQLRRLTLGIRQAPDFDRLPTPFRAVATDMETGQPVILRDGDLATALRSSMSVPGVFAPVEVDGRILGDGGLVNNTPVDVAREMGAHVLIVVNVGTPLAGRDTLGTLTGVTAQMINILTEQNVRRSLASLSSTDVLITPRLDNISSSDFGKALEIMHLGELQAEALAFRLDDLKLSPEEYAEWQAARQRTPRPERPPLRFVRFEGSERTHPELRADMLLSQPGQPFEAARAERDINLLSGSGDYQRTDYRLERAPDGSEGLVFELTDKAWGPDYLQAGLDFSASNRGQSAFNLKLVHNRHWLTSSGTEWRNYLRLGSAPTLGTELYQPASWQLPDGMAGFVSAGLLSVSRNFGLYGPDVRIPTADVRRQTATLMVDAGVNWRELGEWRVGLVDTVWRDETLLRSSDYALRYGDVPAVARWRETGWQTKAVFDQLDHAFFPQQGWRMEASWMQGHHQSREGDTQADGAMRHAEWQGQAVRSWGRHTFQIYSRLGLSDGVTPVVPRYALGGFQQLSGFAPYQVAGQQVGLLRLGHYVRLSDMALTRGVFLGSSVEVGNAWARPQEVWRGPLRSSYSVYLGADTALGPIYAAVVHSPTIGPTVMLFVGRP